ncbi:MAG: DUF6335 family protein [Verrucomicrobiota bacterium]
MSTKARAKSMTPPESSGTGPDEVLSALEEGREPPHQRSITDVADRAALTGVLEYEPARDKIPGQDRVLTVGDPDVDALDNEFSGEEAPGGTNATPDQNDVDEIGRAYGLSEEDDGDVLVSSRRGAGAPQPSSLGARSALEDPEA